MNTFSIEFDAVPENEAFIRITISGFLLYIDPSVEELNDIKTAVSEAVTNVILHAYKDTKGKVYLCCSEENKKIIIHIKDTGVGIADIDKAKEPFYSTDIDSERAGLGFTVMEAYMDSLEIISSENKGTEIIMTKQIV